MSKGLSVKDVAKIVDLIRLYKHRIEELESKLSFVQRALNSTHNRCCSDCEEAVSEADEVLQRIGFFEREAK